MLCLREVEHRYGDLHAVGPVNLEVKAGEFFAIVGPSGCGKSTLLDLMAGLTKPTHGTVENKWASSTAMVFQQDATFPWLTVRENVCFGLRNEVGVSQIIDNVGLTKFESAYPHELSGGMRQRVCLARALARRPQLLLLDEPFGSLDQQTRMLMGEELTELWRQTRCAVVLVTHSIDEAVMLADRVGVLSNRPGRFIQTYETFWSTHASWERGHMKHAGPIIEKVWGTLRPQALEAMGR